MIEILLFLLALVLIPLAIVVALQATGAVIGAAILLVCAPFYWIYEIARRLSGRGKPQELQQAR